MIFHLHIENIAVVECVDIFFSPGFNVLTGETGAGKSIIISAINAICGGKVSKSSIRSGCSKLLVSAVLSNIPEQDIKILNELGYEISDNEVIFHRELTESGKNICKINGRPATVSILRKASNNLIDIYSQNEGYKLLFSENHIKYIDLFGNLQDEIEEYKKLYLNMIEMKREIEKFDVDESEVCRKIEFLEYQISEIEGANVKKGEFEELTNIKRKFNNKQDIIAYLSQAKELLNGENREFGLIEGMKNLRDIMFKVSNYISSAGQMKEQIENMFYDISECLSEISLLLNGMDFNENELEEIEERLDILNKLSRKYGKTEEDILDFLESIKGEMSSLKNCENKSLELKKKFIEIEKCVNEKALRISKKREKVIHLLEKKVEDELFELDMVNARFKVDQEIVDPGQNGIDKIRFFISVNKGEKLRPLEEVASGGEISRIILAIKNILSESDKNTVIFDEVDSGVSGNAANKIGFKLKNLSKTKQVICITHLSQIASLADSHFLIEKHSKKGRTYSLVNKLNFEQRKMELARIMGGINISDFTLKAAEEILSLNKNF